MIEKIDYVSLLEYADYDNIAFAISDMQKIMHMCENGSIDQHLAVSVLMALDALRGYQRIINK